MSTLEPDAVKQGWLYKRGGGRKSNAWRLRWFVLTGPQLYYFKTDKVCVHSSHVFVVLSALFFVFFFFLIERDSSNFFWLIFFSHFFFPFSFFLPFFYLETL
jgi:hypothetical protein